MPLELNYANLRSHEWMLQDAVRCEAFRRAIFDAVTPGCAVLDVGAGTGILSLFAAQAGARVVYAVERTPIAELARGIVADNGLAQRIVVIQADMETVVLPEPVDVIVSEWLGGYALDENLLPLVTLARDRWLKPGGRLIPETVTSWLAPAYDPGLQQDIDFWHSEPYGVDLGAIGAIRARQADCAGHQVRQGQLLCAGRPMWEVAARTCSRADADRPWAACLEFIADRDGQINVLAAWFRARLSDRVVLCNGPEEPDTHWGRSIFPVGQVVSVDKGARVLVRFVHEPWGKGMSRALWEIEVGGYRFRSTDLTTLTG